MKNWSLLSSGKVLFGLILSFIISIGYAFYSENTSGLQLILVFSVPFFALFYFLKYSVLSVSMAAFLLFFFSVNFFSSAFQGGNFSVIKNVMNLLALGSLILNVIPRFKGQQLNKWLRVYIVGIFVIGMCFLFETTHFLSVFLIRNFEFYILVFQGLTLLVLSILAFINCLVAQTKLNIHFFIAVVSFGFALTVDCIVLYYLNDLTLVLLNQLFKIIGLYFVFAFMFEDGKNKYEKPIRDYQVLHTEIMAS